MSARSDFEIRELDKSLAVDGEWIELQRLAGTQLIPVKVKCRAFVRGYGADELIGGITQTDSKVIISPSEIIKAGWPGPNSSATPTKQDRRVPRVNDKAVIVGKTRNIAVSLPIYVDGELVRVDMRVSG